MKLAITSMCHVLCYSGACSGLGGNVENMHERLVLSTQTTSTGKVFLPPPFSQIGIVR